MTDLELNKFSFFVLDDVWELAIFSMKHKKSYLVMHIILFYAQYPIVRMRSAIATNQQHCMLHMARRLSLATIRVPISFCLRRCNANKDRVSVYVVCERLIFKWG